METEILKKFTEKVSKTFEVFQKELAIVKAGRANTNLLDNILVNYYGSSLPINQLANINVPDPQMLVVVPWEKGACKEIEKSIIKANIGITPQSDGTVIRLPIPPLTKERRQELVKQVKRLTENYKNSIRGSRRDSNQQTKEQEKNKLISEDSAKKTEIEIQKLTNEWIAKVESKFKEKEKDLLTV